MRTKKTTSIILCMAIAWLLSSCAASPPAPKQPSKAKRAPINQTVPVELGGLSE